MRLAVFADIHGNLPALEALQADLRQQAPDALVCLGDVAMTGPFPNECLEALAAMNCPVVMGNADEALLRPWPDFKPRGLPDEQEIYDLDAWSHTEVSERGRAIVHTFEPIVRPLPGVLAFHGSPASNTEVLDAGTDEPRLAELRAEFGSDAVWIGGHTHKPLLRTQGGWRLLNPGSVGMPFKLRGGRFVNPPRAEYLLLDAVGSSWDVQFRQVPYPVRLIQDGFRAAGVPHAERFASDWVDT